MKRMMTIFAAVTLTIGCQNDQPRAKTADKMSDDTNLARAQDQSQQANKVNSDKLQLAAAFWGPMPTGVAVSKTGRVFVNFPRWGDPVEFTVGEVKNGKVTAFPDNDSNKLDENDAKNTLVSVQSVVVDEQD